MISWHHQTVGIFWDYDSVHAPSWGTFEKVTKTLHEKVTADCGTLHPSSDGIATKSISIVDFVERRLYYSDFGKAFLAHRIGEDELRGNHSNNLLDDDDDGFILVDCSSAAIPSCDNDNSSTKYTLQKKLIEDLLFFVSEQKEKVEMMKNSPPSQDVSSVTVILITSVHKRWTVYSHFLQEISNYVDNSNINVALVYQNGGYDILKNQLPNEKNADDNDSSKKKESVLPSEVLLTSENENKTHCESISGSSAAPDAIYEATQFTPPKLSRRQRKIEREKAKNAHFLNKSHISYQQQNCYSTATGLEETPNSTIYYSAEPTHFNPQEPSKWRKRIEEELARKGHIPKETHSHGGRQQQSYQQQESPQKQQQDITNNDIEKNKYDDMVAMFCESVYHCSVKRHKINTEHSNEEDDEDTTSPKTKNEDEEKITFLPTKCWTPQSSVGIEFYRRYDAIYKPTELTCTGSTSNGRRKKKKKKKKKNQGKIKESGALKEYTKEKKTLFYFIRDRCLSSSDMPSGVGDHDAVYVCLGQRNLKTNMIMPIEIQCEKDGTNIKDVYKEREVGTETYLRLTEEGLRRMFRRKK